MALVSACVTQLPELTIVALDGALTGAAILPVESCLAPLLKQTRPILVMDLSGLHTCDSTGALILVVAARVATEVGGEVRLAAPAGPVCRALRASDTMAAVRTFATVDGAVRADPLDLLAAVAV